MQYITVLATTCQNLVSRGELYNNLLSTFKFHAYNWYVEKSREQFSFLSNIYNDSELLCQRLAVRIPRVAKSVLPVMKLSYTRLCVTQYKFLCQVNTTYCLQYVTSLSFLFQRTQIYVRSTQVCLECIYSRTPEINMTAD